MKNRSLILINKLFKLLISIRSSVRALNIAHVTITSYTHLDNRRRQNIVFPELKLFALTPANPSDTIILPCKGWDEELAQAWRLAPSFPKGGDGVASDFYLPCLEVYGDYHDP